MKLQFLHTCIVLALHIETRTAVPLVHCGPGEKLVLAHGQKSDVCVPCPSRQYQNKKHHRETSCQRCSPFDHFDSRLVLEDECTRTDYRIVRCVDGYYLLEGQCKICTNCSMLGKAQGQACKKDKDTVCCDVEGMVVKNEKCEFDPVHCGLGEYLVPGLNGRPGRCETCHPGSYQDENKHRLHRCPQCSEFDIHNPRLILEDECTKFHDIRVSCVDGHYLKEDDCHTCTNCSLLGKVQGRACQHDQDTVCCDKEGMVVKNGKCMFDPTHCGPGEYLVLGTDGQPGSCEFCQPGFYQDKPNHRLLYCLQCAAFDSLNPRLVLADECTRFHNTKFRCRTGFYLKEEDCYPCTNCALLGKFKERACSKEHDTICCDFQGMIVENGICKFGLIYCGAGEYLVPGMSGHRDECRPCGDGSNNPEHRHRNTNCSVIHTTGKSGSTGSSEMIAMPMIFSLLVAVPTVCYCCYKRRSLVIRVC
ncbi:hypothetical protein RRG08_060218 [Elysia crispata]|uniref:TNFR-Cys domain-containing protein n=1 Tax=Elysia crispata TaxID=231223 RepID=A0AAE1AEC5_9GAST|nr:hypothetical protein RRG08_060218 [Elysia crispata]